MLISSNEGRTLMPCSKTIPGHAVHYLQMRHRSDGPVTTVRLVRVQADGHLTFSDGTTRWNHDPERLASAIGTELCELWSDNLLIGNGTAFSLAPTADPREGDSLGTSGTDFLPLAR